MGSNTISSPKDLETLFQGIEGMTPDTINAADAGNSAASIIFNSYDEGGQGLSDGQLNQLFGRMEGIANSFHERGRYYNDIHCKVCASCGPRYLFYPYFFTQQELFATSMECCCCPALLSVIPPYCILINIAGLCSLCNPGCAASAGIQVCCYQIALTSASVSMREHAWDMALRHEAFRCFMGGQGHNPHLLVPTPIDMAEDIKEHRGEIPTRHATQPLMREPNPHNWVLQRIPLYASGSSLNMFKAGILPGTRAARQLQRMQMQSGGGGELAMVGFSAPGGAYSQQPGAQAQVPPPQYARGGTVDGAGAGKASPPSYGVVTAPDGAAAAAPAAVFASPSAGAGATPLELKSTADSFAKRLTREIMEKAGPAAADKRDAVELTVTKIAESAELEPLMGVLARDATLRLQLPGEVAGKVARYVGAQLDSAFADDVRDHLLVAQDAARMRM